MRVEWIAVLISEKHDDCALLDRRAALGKARRMRADSMADWLSEKRGGSALTRSRNGSRKSATNAR
jgi:hypothetical protein